MTYRLVLLGSAEGGPPKVLLDWSLVPVREISPALVLYEARGTNPKTGLPMDVASQLKATHDPSTHPILLVKRIFNLLQLRKRALTG